MAEGKKRLEGVPSYDKMMIPVLETLVTLGGSGTVEEINEKVYEILNISEEVLQVAHNENSSQSRY